MSCENNEYKNITKCVNCYIVSGNNKNLTKMLYEDPNKDYTSENNISVRCTLCSLQPFYIPDNSNIFKVKLTN
jgi:hypothetical protein